MHTSEAGRYGWAVSVCAAVMVLACPVLPLGESHAATRFAVISDLGSTLPTASNPVGPIVAAVANQIKAGRPDLILTTGDNCHDVGGGAPTGYYDIDVGQYFHEYIGGYVGAYGEGSPTNRFWPALGNHDYADGLPYYKAFFPALGNQRYYDFTAGAAHFFVLDSSASDGDSPTSAQAQWLQAGLAASTSPWNFVFVHEPPYTSSDRHSPSTNLRWNYKAWGADAVFAGHIHAYERMSVDGLTYFTTSAVGETLAQGFVDRLGDQSLYYYRADYGGMQVDVDGTEATFSFVTRGGLVLDTYTQAVQANEFTADGGSYNLADHWQRGRAVSAPDAVALFQQPLAGPVTVDAPVTLGALALHSPGGSTLAGPAAVRLETTGGAIAALTAQAGDHEVGAPLTILADTRFEVLDHTLTLSGLLDGSAGKRLTKTGDGTLVVGGSQAYAAGTVFDASAGRTAFQTDAGAAGAHLAIEVRGGATVDLAATQRASRLTIQGGGTVRLTDGSPGLLAVAGPGLIIDAEAGGVLDLGGGRMILDYAPGEGPADQVTEWLRLGLSAAGGFWDGPGIRSSAAAVRPDRLAAVGLLDNTDPRFGGLTEFAGQAIDATTLLAAYTWCGDANLDGVVDANDFDVIDKSSLFPPGTAAWWTGDFNYDRLIDANDYDLIDRAYLFQTGPLGDGAPMPTPEPATLALAALGGLALAARRRRPAA